MKEPFAEADDSDIDRPHDRLASWPIQDELSAAAADIQRQHIGDTVGQSRANPQQCSPGFFFTRNDLNFEIGFAFDVIEKLVSIARIAYRACRDDGAVVYPVGLDHLSPLAQACDDSIHCGPTECLGLIDTFTQSKNAPIRSKFRESS